ncbi:S-adenosylmethionine:tRNA ribosyltransferase-isomerase, partial [Pseudoroseomonas sp. WGS1072]
MTPDPALPPLRAEDFDFALPEALIAQSPARPRDAARLLVASPDGLRDGS